MNKPQILKQFFSSDSVQNSIVERLLDMGLYVGIEVQILRKISFGQVTILQFDQTILALNKTEMSCLIF